MRQGNSNARASARQTLLDTMYEFAFEVGSNRELARIIGEGCNSWDDLSDGDRAQYNLLVMRFTGNVQNGLLLHREGMLDSDTLAFVAGNLAATVKTRGGSVWWRHAPVPPEARSFVDALDTLEGQTIQDLFPYWVRSWDSDPPR